ncbi:hypothetical protein Tco_1102862 [Tanacetum coccineum]
MHKTTKIAEEQENVAKVQEKILEDDAEKIVEGEDEESYAIDDDDVDDKKDENKDDDDDEDDDIYDHDDHTLVRNNVTRSSKDRNEKMQTPIPSPLDPIGQTYPRIRLFLKN